MLAEFNFSNFASYFSNASLCMKAAGANKEFKYLNTFENEHGEFLKSCLVYGANGSGKSNFIKAISFMKDMVMLSFERENITKSCSKFLFSSNSKDSASNFEVVFVADGDKTQTIYKYGFEILNEKISKEWLYRKSQRIIPIFERTSPNFQDIKILGKTMKKAESIKQYTRENALFISTAYKFNIPIAEIVRQWFEKLVIIDFDVLPGYTAKLISENESVYKPWILKYLKRADFGISDLVVEIKDFKVKEESPLKPVLDKLYEFMENHIDSEEVVGYLQKKVDIKSKHGIYNDNKELVGSKYLSFLEYQSDGTIKFFEIIGPIIDALVNRKVLIIDEIDSRLHCAIVRFIISLFHSIDTNGNNAQLIATTHDVLLLEEDIRRDQIWFVQKNEYGESEIYSLIDFKGIKKNDLLLKKYLLGSFGAIPFIEKV
ncbi:MAG: ATP-binding protein [Clostridia bacterium]|nr:ATP-binding protein [Clostridia bacterium]